MLVIDKGWRLSIKTKVWIEKKETTEYCRNVSISKKIRSRFKSCLFDYQIFIYKFRIFHVTSIEQLIENMKCNLGIALWHKELFIKLPLHHWMNFSLLYLLKNLFTRYRNFWLNLPLLCYDNNNNLFA